MTDPVLTLHRGGALLAANDNWSATSENRDEVLAAATGAGAFELAEGSADAALVVSLPPGVYTALAKTAPTDSTDGLALLEIFVVD